MSNNGPVISVENIEVSESEYFSSQGKQLGDSSALADTAKHSISPQQNVTESSKPLLCTPSPERTPALTPKTILQYGVNRSPYSSTQTRPKTSAIKLPSNPIPHPLQFCLHNSLDRCSRTRSPACSSSWFWQCI